MRNKKCLFSLEKVMIVVALICVPFSSVQAYTFSPIVDLSGWQDFRMFGDTSAGYGPGSVQLTANGHQSFRWVYTDVHDAGMMARVQVSSADCSYCSTNIRRVIGVVGENEIWAEVRVESWDDRRTISYRVREMTDVDVNPVAVRFIALGFFGTGYFTGASEWEVGSPVDVAIGMEGNSVVFYSGNHNFLTRVQLLEPLTPPVAEPFSVLVYTEGDGGSIAATLDNIRAVGVN